MPEPEQRAAAASLILKMPEAVREVLLDDAGWLATGETDPVVCTVRDHVIVAGLRRQLWQWDGITERQVMLVARLIDQERERRRAAH